MILNLDQETERLIQQEIDLGRFSAPAEVVRYAVEQLHTDEEWTAEDKLELHHHLTESMAQVARGEGIPGDHLFERLAAMRASRYCCRMSFHRARLTT